MQSCPKETSIIGVSWAASCTAVPEKLSSSASAGLFLAPLPPRSEHQRHQLGGFLHSCHKEADKEASIIGISWAASCAAAPAKLASSASAGLLLAQLPQRREHHQHLPGCFLHSCPKEASSIGISLAVSCTAALRLPFELHHNLPAQNSVSSPQPRSRPAVKFR